MDTLNVYFYREVFSLIPLDTLRNWTQADVLGRSILRIELQHYVNSYRDQTLHIVYSNCPRSRTYKYRIIEASETIWTEIPSDNAKLHFNVIDIAREPFDKTSSELWSSTSSGISQKLARFASPFCSLHIHDLLGQINVSSFLAPICHRILSFRCLQIIDVETLEDILKTFVNLKEVSISRCPLIDGALVDALIERCEKVDLMLSSPIPHDDYLKMYIRDRVDNLISLCSNATTKKFNHYLNFDGPFPYELMKTHRFEKMGINRYILRYASNTISAEVDLLSVTIEVATDCVL
ncbi:hypothetical protein QR680_010039 [Steinernema hermaphroditum]|uniref:Uncharacterized protein n=1 Tax=Steinernema hermaphroditum TaxID=289476 RepID=A0AA39IMI0_9BILA|nr:hypothetical protein QR680_010039 [Steinernema hermaphroditum]